ncbi:hypothetical protein NUW58_g207 [Xylaria curta]|uniref:Uncharacterized protein n=1 Tax=Xylaria curta TaxID=42375 RepID=A0ACC1PRR6_9PEZI|nr:hypothetical protein NUW58_g207 [Xylaria curta]
MPNAPRRLMEDAGPGPVLHARANGHGGRAQCICGMKFGRADSLKRHIKRHTKDPQHPCPHCDGRQGPKAFHRRDHLVQHMRHVHRNDRSPRDLESQEQALAPASEPQSVELGQSQPSGSQRPQFPCPLPGCMSYGELSYTHQYYLNEHLFYFYGVLPDSIYTYPGQPFMASFPTNNEPGQAQGAQGAFQQDADFQPGLVGVNIESSYVALLGALEGELSGGKHFRECIDRLRWIHLDLVESNAYTSRIRASSAEGMKGEGLRVGQSEDKISLNISSPVFSNDYHAFYPNKSIHIWHELTGHANLKYLALPFEPRDPFTPVQPIVEASLSSSNTVAEYENQAIESADPGAGSQTSLRLA